MKTVNAHASPLNLLLMWSVTEPLRETDPNLERVTIRLHPAQSAAFKCLPILFLTDADREWLRQQEREVQRAVGLFLRQVFELYTHRARFLIDSTIPKDKVEFWCGLCGYEFLAGQFAGEIVGLAVPMGFE